MLFMVLSYPVTYFLCALLLGRFSLLGCILFLWNFFSILKYVVTLGLDLFEISDHIT